MRTRGRAPRLRRSRLLKYLRVPQMLDDAGFPNASIVLSNELDELSNPEDKTTDRS